MPAPANLVHEVSATTGTGNFTLSEVSGKVRFSDTTYGFSTGGSDVFDYFISNRNASEWERGTGHMLDANTLVRDTVIHSSNSDAAVNFSSGTKDVVNDVPAAKQVVTDLTQTLTNKTITTPTITLKQSSSPTPTAEGDIQWDTDDNAIVIGDGAAQAIFYKSIDEDSFSTNSATRVPTQQSVKAYVDAHTPAGYDQLLNTVAYNAMILADVMNFAQFPSADRIADSFDDLTYVDTAGATNLDTGTAGLLKATTSAGTDQTATHTSATQSGNTASESSYTSGYPGWQAFDKVTGGATGVGCWVSNATATGWLQYQFGSAKTIGSYTVRSGNGYANRAPKDWTLKGSNDGSSWTVVDTVTSQTSWTAGGEQRSFTVDTPGSYTYYRLDVTANNTDSYLQIDEVTLVSLVPNNLTVASTSLLFSAQPDIMFGQVLVREVGSVTANTDFLLDFSRNNGTNWVTSTLTLIRSIPIAGSVTLKHYATNNVDMTANAFATACKYRLRTANNKFVEFRAMYAYGS